MIATASVKWFRIMVGTWGEDFKFVRRGVGGGSEIPNSNSKQSRRKFQIPKRESFSSLSKISCGWCWCCGRILTWPLTLSLSPIFLLLVFHACAGGEGTNKALLGSSPGMNPLSLPISTTRFTRVRGFPCARQTQGPGSSVGRMHLNSRGRGYEVQKDVGKDKG